MGFAAAVDKVPIDETLDCDVTLSDSFTGEHIEVPDIPCDTCNRCTGGQQPAVVSWRISQVQFSANEICCESLLGARNLACSTTTACKWEGFPNNPCFGDPVWEFRGVTITLDVDELRASCKWKNITQPTSPIFQVVWAKPITPPIDCNAQHDLSWVFESEFHNGDPCWVTDPSGRPSWNGTTFIFQPGGSGP